MTNSSYEANIQAMAWDGLQALWRAIRQGDTPGWEPGKAFEYLVLRLFDLDGALVRWPYRVDLWGEEVEQIDGAFHTHELSCLVESKDLTDNVDVGPIAKLRNQLQRRPAGTIGLMFSSTRFTQPAVLLAHFSASHPILLWEGLEVDFMLQTKAPCDYLVSKFRSCIEEGKPDASKVKKEKTP